HGEVEARHEDEQDEDQQEDRRRIVDTEPPRQGVQEVPPDREDEEGTGTRDPDQRVLLAELAAPDEVEDEEEQQDRDGDCHDLNQACHRGGISTERRSGTTTNATSSRDSASAARGASSDVRPARRPRMRTGTSFVRSRFRWSRRRSSGSGYPVG